MGTVRQIEVRYENIHFGEKKKEQEETGLLAVKKKKEKKRFFLFFIYFLYVWLKKKKKRDTYCLRYAEGSKRNKDYTKVMVPGGRRDSEVVNGNRREPENRGWGKR